MILGEQVSNLCNSNITATQEGIILAVPRVLICGNNVQVFQLHITEWSTPILEYVQLRRK